MILSRHDGIHQGQVEASGGRELGKPTSLGRERQRNKAVSRSDPHDSDPP